MKKTFYEDKSIFIAIHIAMYSFTALMLFLTAYFGLYLIVYFGSLCLAIIIGLIDKYLEHLNPNSIKNMVLCGLLQNIYF